MLSGLLCSQTLQSQAQKMSFLFLSAAQMYLVRALSAPGQAELKMPDVGEWDCCSSSLGRRKAELTTDFLVEGNNFNPAHLLASLSSRKIAGEETACRGQGTTLPWRHVPRPCLALNLPVGSSRQAKGAET